MSTTTALAWSLLATINFLSGQVQYYQEQLKIEQAEKQEREERYLADFIMNDLAWCESGQREDIKVLDVNGKYSYGWLQFQLHTFLYQGKRFGILPEALTQEEAKFLIKKKGIQVAIAREMLQEKDGWKHWFYCAQKVGLHKLSQL